jgi:hypothetical protein
MRRMELEKFQEIQDQAHYIKEAAKLSVLSDLEERNVHLAAALAQLQASESALKNNLEYEKLRVAQLTDKLVKLSSEQQQQQQQQIHLQPQRIYDQLTDSLEPFEMTKALKIRKISHKSNQTDDSAISQESKVIIIKTASSR